MNNANDSAVSDYYFFFPPRRPPLRLADFPAFEIDLPAMARFFT